MKLFVTHFLHNVPGLQEALPEFRVVASEAAITGHRYDMIVAPANTGSPTYSVDEYTTHLKPDGKLVLY
jgi:hypothetical protein